MIPSIDDRLDSMARALAEVVLPALPNERSMAIEQAHLILAQIGVIREQLDDAPLFEKREAGEMIALAGRLLDMAEGGRLTVEAAGALRVTLGAISLGTPEGTRRATRCVGEAIETLIEASRLDGSAAFRTTSLDEVLGAGRAAATRDRSWNRSSGFEADDSQVPGIDQLRLRE